uniref:Uncharacterized protein n=1 Tax=Rhizophora mucronata TaxID=61149 RepID=A0A2P2NKK1_RHIMU
MLSLNWFLYWSAFFSILSTNRSSIVIIGNIIPSLSNCWTMSPG